MFVIDIDRFKQVNDGLGISAGDTILLTIARRLHRLLKPRDALSRFAGDQFALMLLSEQDPARIAAVADAVNQAIKAPITFAKREIVLTASIGLLTWTSAQATAEDMVKDAELAMHQAKRYGGDRIEPFRPAFRSVGTDRLQLESDLRRAIERKEITLAYQPIVQAGGPQRRRLRGAAALGAPAPRRDPAVRLHPGRRELRADRPARPVRHAAGGRRPRRLAKADRRRAAVGLGQPVQPPADPPRPGQRRALGDRALADQRRAASGSSSPSR